MTVLFNKYKISIETDVTPEQFGKIGSFNVTVSCFPAYDGTDKELMDFVCNYLTGLTEGRVRIKTRYVISCVSLETANNDMCKVKGLVFQALTPNCSLWYY